MKWRKWGPNLVDMTHEAQTFIREGGCWAHVSGGRYVPARPLATPLAPRAFRRLRLAWRVFTGQYDALRWTEQ